jgi:hypothetical protein
MISLTFNSRDYETYILTQIKKLQPGEMFSLYEMPKSINVEIHLTFDGNLNITKNRIKEDKRKQWIEDWNLPTLDVKKTNIIIPITY